MKLEPVLTIAQVAKLAGWRKRRMARHLEAMNRELGGLLLRDVGRKGRARWTVTLAALQRIAPQWFTDAASVEARVELIEERVVRLERVQEVHTEAIARIVA